MLQPDRLKKRLTLLLITAPSFAVGYFAMAQTPRQQGDRPEPPKPPREMLAVCKGKAEGAACSGKLPGGQLISGACHAPPSLPLACAPAGGMGPPPKGGGPSGGMGMAPPPPAPPADQGAAIAAAAADTGTVACGLAGQGHNASARLDFRRGVTPEFPRGIYRSYATDAYPYIQRCVKGRPARAMADAGGTPPFSPGFGPPPGAPQ